MKPELPATFRPPAPPCTTSLTSPTQMVLTVSSATG